MSETVFVKTSQNDETVVCQVVQIDGRTITFDLPGGKVPAVGEKVLLVAPFHRQLKAQAASVAEVSGKTVKVTVMEGLGHLHEADDSLADCQLPAMFRARSQDGHFGCWKGAVIVKHGPDRLILQVEHDKVVPEQAELMFSPIGADAAASSARMYGDDGSVISASDVRSRKIRVRAITKDVLSSEVEGTVLLVFDVTRTLYRTA